MWFIGVEVEEETRFTGLVRLMICVLLKREDGLARLPRSQLLEPSSQQLGWPPPYKRN